MARAKGTQNKTFRGVKKHTYRPRRLCQGDATYERLMAEAQVEFNEAVERNKTRFRNHSVRARAAKEKS